MDPIYSGGASGTSISFALPTAVADSRNLSGGLQAFNLIKVTVGYPNGTSQVFQANPTISGALCMVNLTGLQSRTQLKITLAIFNNGVPVYIGSAENINLNQRVNNVGISLFALYPQQDHSLSAKEDLFFVRNPDGTVTYHGKQRYEPDNSNIANWLFRINSSPSIRQIATSRCMSMALMNSGNLLVPVYTENLTESTAISAGAAALFDNLRGRTISRINSGPHQFLALLSDGSLYSWGALISGQMRGTADGNGYITTPQLICQGGVVDFGGGGIKDGSNTTPGYTAVLKSDGTIWVWGNSVVGLHSTSLTQVPNLRDVVKIACGYDYILALKSDGTVYGWGSNTVINANIAYNVIDRSTLGSWITSYASPHLVPMASGKCAVNIAASWATSVILYSDGSLDAWGGVSLSTGTQFAGTVLDIAASNFMVVLYSTNLGATHCHYYEYDDAILKFKWNQLF